MSVTKNPAAKTVAAKPTPAVKAAEAKAVEIEKPKTVDLLDFSTLEVKDVKVEEIKHTRPSQLDTTPVLAWLRESFEKDQAKSVTLPSIAAAEAMETLLRSGAARLKIGVKIVTTPAPAGEGVPEGAQIVKFLGKNKRAYTAPAKK